MEIVWDFARFYEISRDIRGDPHTSSLSSRPRLLFVARPRPPPLPLSPLSRILEIRRDCTRLHEIPCVLPSIHPFSNSVPPALPLGEKQILFLLSETTSRFPSFFFFRFSPYADACAQACVRACARARRRARTVVVKREAGEERPRCRQVLRYILFYFILYYIVSIYI